MKFVILCSLTSALAIIFLTACKDTSNTNDQNKSEPNISSSNSSISTRQDNLTGIRHLPNDKKVLFIMGQDSETLSDFKNHVLQKDSDFPQPGGVTLYTKISDSFTYESLSGLTSDVDYGSGIINFTTTMNEFPNSALVVGLNITDTHAGCKSIPTKAIAGMIGDEVTPELVNYYHGEVDKFILYLKDINRDVFLRIGYEFDGPWNCYDAEAYKGTFKFIKGRIDTLEAKNIATVWQTATWLRDQEPYIVTDQNHLDKFYPGDEVVDWISFSKFYGEHYRLDQWTCDELNPEWFTPHVTPVSQHDRLLNFARLHKKPVMIAESAPVGYSNSELTSSCILTNRPKPTTAEKIWNNWYQDWFNYIEKNTDIIRAVAYINTNWHSQKMWHCSPQAMAGEKECKEGYWGDSRIQANPYILDKFKSELKKYHFSKNN